MKNKNYESLPSTTTEYDMDRRSFAMRLGAGAVVALLGTGVSRYTPESASARTEDLADIIENLDSNADAYADHEAVDPNILTGASDEERADMMTIHERMDEDEAFAEEITNKLGLLFNVNLTAEGAKDAWEKYGTLDNFPISNTNEHFSPLMRELFGSDYHATLVESGVIDIAEINQTLENFSKFKNQIDTKFLIGIMEHHTADTVTTVKVNEYQASDDEPILPDSDGVVAINATFANATLDSSGNPVSTADFSVNMIFERHYDPSESRTIALPRGFSFKAE